MSTEREDWGQSPVRHMIVDTLDEVGVPATPERVMAVLRLLYDVLAYFGEDKVVHTKRKEGDRG